MIDNIQDLIPINSRNELDTYQQILDNTAIIVLTDINGIVRHVNRKYCDISGYQRHEMVGKSLDSIRLNKPEDAEHKMMWETLKAGKIWKGEFLNCKKNGDAFWEEACIYPFAKEDGGVYQFISIGSDITSFKNAMQIKDQFMANISHELRTPLHSIYSFSNMLAETSLNAEQNDFVDNIVTATGILMRMVEDMLDLNKIESGQIKFDQKIFNPHVLMHALGKMYSEKAREKKLEFILEYDPALPEFIEGDPFRLKQVLIHLLENAVKYTRQGFVKLKCRAGDKKEGRCVFEFSVEDSGIGIPADSVKMILEKFQQVTMDNTRTFGGPGLGLSIVKQLVELQKGKFHMESQPQQGTKVQISVPFCETSGGEAMEKTEQAVAYNGSSGTMKVLIAEDVDINQMVIKKHMQKFGFTAEFADNGKIAIEKLRNQAFDIVLMDMQMPVMDGYEAIKIIRNEFPKDKKDIPIISITASVMGEAPRKCLEAGADDYVPKPYNVAELKQKMEQWVNQNKTHNHTNNQAMQQNTNNDQKLIDLEYLEQLSDGDDDFSINLMSYFLDNTPAVLQEMKQYYDEKDWGSLRNVAHKFKPQITFMGIKSVFQEVENMEQYAKNASNLDEIPHLISRTTDVVTRAMEEIKMELEKLLDKNQ